MRPLLIRISIATLGVAATLLLAAAPAAAQDGDIKAQARWYVTEGLAAQDDGRFDDAIELYNQAYALVPHPEILFNLGQAHRLAGDKPAAVGYYRKYLAVDGKGRVAKEARAWVDQLDAEILADQARATETLRLEEEARATEAARVAEQKRAARRTRVAEQKRAARRARAAEPPPVVAEAPLPPAETAEDDPPSAPRGLGGKRKVSLGLGGAAVVSLGSALAFELSSQRSYDDYLGMPGGQARDDRFEDAERKRLYAEGLAVVGVACGLVAGYLWFTGGESRAERTARVTPLLAPGVAGLAVVGGF